MYTLTLPSKRDVHRYRDRLKSICDKYGVRLGKSNEKAETILAELFDCPNYNTLLGIASRSNDKEPTLIDKSEILRLALPRTTHGAKDRIINIVREFALLGDSPTKLVSFFHRKGALKSPVMGFCFTLTSGRVLLFDSHGISLVNDKQESVVISLYTHIRELLPTSCWYFAAMQFDDMSLKSVIEVSSLIENAGVKVHALSWRELFPLSQAELSPIKRPLETIAQWESLFSK
ncbi:hypothetical protein MKZ42_03200 [Pseudoalteromonas shioyasakiensis]|uniref:Uncharacterized protein n=1 Tax=Pseudoalteromonas shioyasakiensis TaxID=1190813 RepID=A0ABT6U4B3_9GAMM|nr:MULTISPECIES: hypothetical protein [Pseudoalteromonas]MDI4670994.1 hypothetical protein [Pseudoalteromonas shioyasakiensis]MDI4672269.1 hypothetical protein [Pseudoalteromonas shioyasakiensis]MDI4687903.1 hypothetical protein [Pseudoalteromonas shioyasakiensis]MDI4706499.1 hypothetical protein [Pseudoalteromonas shioyasakiensis]NUJ23251.1 hypothetical protein [Pseudoalteromonas sp. 0802]